MPGPDGRTEWDDVVRWALARLPSESREAFLLKHVEELEYEDMARLTGAGRLRAEDAREAGAGAAPSDAERGRACLNPWTTRSNGSRGTFDGAHHPRVERRVDPHREITTVPQPGGATLLGATWRWLRRPHQVALSPLGGLAAAAALAVVVLLFRTDSKSPAPLQAESRAFQFVLVAPRATHVSLVGDFNDWDATRTPMRRAGSEALWTVVVPLAPGRYHYAFFVDGSRWLADPSAPVARDEDYGAPSSVLTVGGGGS